MKQNIYDDPEFFSGYMALRANEEGLNAAIEEPAVRSFLPELVGLSVLDLGCGFGAFADYCIDRGVNRFVGFDISEKMIGEAKRRRKDRRASFSVGAIEDVEFEKASFDVVVSSMCLHYVADLASVLREAASALRPGGRIVLSVEHPVCTSLLAGWHSAGRTPRLHWPVDNYFNEGARSARWFVDGVVKYHRTVETYVRTALAAGFSIAGLLEPKPAETLLAVRPGLVEHARRPAILVMAGDKKPSR